MYVQQKYTLFDLPYPCASNKRVFLQDKMVEEDATELKEGEWGLYDNKWLLYMNNLTLACPMKVVFQDHKCTDCLWLETGTAN